MNGSEIYDNGFINLSLAYTRNYENNPHNFIRCFHKFKSIRSASEEIVKTYKKIGAFEECKKSGKDFTGWANKQNVIDKVLLAEILLIIYSIINK